MAIKADAEKFIGEKLGLGAGGAAIAGKRGEIEACEPDKKTARVKL